MPSKSAKAGGKAPKLPATTEKSANVLTNQAAQSPEPTSSANERLKNIKENSMAIVASGAVDTESESESDAEIDVDMVVATTSQPVTPTTAKTPAIITPVTPLKPGRKRQRTNTSDSQKSTKQAGGEDTNDCQKLASPASGEDGDAWRQRLYKSMKETVTVMEQASGACQDYSFYGSLIENLKNAIGEVENPARPTKTKGLATSSWAGVAKAPNGPKGPIVIKQPSNSKAPRVKGPQQTAAKAKAKSTPKESKEDRQVILRLKKDPTRVSIPSHGLRNELNEIIGKTAITSVELSARGNIVITTNKPYTANELLTSVREWKSVFEAYPVEAAEIPTSWVKLVAHGVPVLSEIDTIGIFQQEAETFNPVKIKGTPRWLKAPTEDKRAGSVVFAVPTEEEALYSRKNGLYIAGVRVKVAVFKAFTQKTQCYRCQGFGHNPTLCNKPVACAICSKKHLTRMHKCTSCNASQVCEHIAPACVNCKGKHAANNRECEVYRAVVS